MKILFFAMGTLVLGSIIPLPAEQLPIYNPGSSGALPQPFPLATPTHLHFLASNVFGGTFRIDLKDGNIICHRDEVDKTSSEKSTHPSTSDWRKFIRTLNAGKTYEWAPYYKNNNVLDGGGWELELVVGKAEFYSKGNNAFPRDGSTYLPAGSGDTVRSFDIVWKALCTLAGEDSTRFPLK